MAYRIDLTRSAVKELEKLSSKTHDNVVKNLRMLEQEPRMFDVEKLAGIEAYKLRIVYQRLRRKK